MADGSIDSEATKRERKRAYDRERYLKIRNVLLAKLQQRYREDVEYRDSCLAYQANRRSDPDKKRQIKEQDREYYLRNRDKLLAKYTTPESYARTRKWRLLNLERERAKQRTRAMAYRKLLKEQAAQGDPAGIYARHIKTAQKVCREWRKKNPEQYRVQIGNRAARERNAEGTFTADDIAQIRKLQRDKCAYCPRSLNGKGHIDHIIALAKSGSNKPSNLQLTCKSCNSRKNTKDPMLFARELGMLL